MTLLEPMFVWKMNQSISPFSTNLTLLPGQSHNGAAAVAEAFLSLKARIHKILDQTAWKGEMEIYKSTSFAVEKNGSPLIPSFTITGDVFLRETCFVWQWRLVNLSDFAYHKCIHLNVDVESSIRNTFWNSWYLLWEVLLLAALINSLVCVHPSTGSPQHQWRDPHPGPSKASLQRRWQIIPSVAWGVLSRQKNVGPKTKSFLPMFSFNLFHPSHILANFAMKIF